MCPSFEVLPSVVMLVVEIREILRTGCIPVLRGTGSYELQ